MKIFTVIYYKMPIPCNNMVNSIENAHIKGSCGILWYPAVSCGNQTDPVSTDVYRSGRPRPTAIIEYALTDSPHLSATLFVTYTLYLRNLYVVSSACVCGTGDIGVLGRF